MRKKAANSLCRRVTAAILAAVMACSLLAAGVYAETEGEDGAAVTDSSTTLLELESDLLTYPSAGRVTMQIANAQRNGIYFLYGTSLQFYSLEEHTYSLAYTFSGCTRAYAENDMLYVLYGTSCEIFDLNSGELDRSLTFDNLASEESVTYTTTAIGADSEGRIYLATKYSADSGSVYELWLYDADGSLLSSAETDARVNRFSGFDPDSGNFYMESSYNWVYWGYDHYGYGVTMGNVTDNVITPVDTSGSVAMYGGLVTYSLDCLEYLCQSTYYYHQTGAALIGGHYLVTASTTFGRVLVSDMSTYTTILQISRAAIEEEQSGTTDDVNSIGVRAVYHESEESVIVYENGKVLNEYDLETGELLASCETSHYVFNLLIMDDLVIAVEKEDGVFYLELFSWESPTDFEIEAETDTMRVGESQQLTVTNLSVSSSSYTWSSSDSSILSVTSDGMVSAWAEGTAAISYSSPDGTYAAEYTITVSGSTVTDPAESVLTVSGTVSDNLSDNNITGYSASTVKSYLTENEDGSLTRVEYLSSAGVLVEVLDPDTGSVTSSVTLEPELSIWGGFYSGEDYNYLVYGQANYDEDDSAEVIRVVRYTKSWERVDACSIYGANTYVPFAAGSLRMAETDGALYLYSCHTMYAGSDETHHQANMTFVIDEETMTVTDSYYDVMNITYGYVSHSFNQFIQTDGEYVYRVDLGDAYPRAVTITRAAVGEDITSVSYTYALAICGTAGYNYTGVSVGGFELSAENCLIAGNSVDQSDEDTYDVTGQRNIFLTVTDKDGLTTETIWLTDYEESDGVTVRTPQLVKLSDDQFLLMWEESSGGSVTTRMVTVNGDGAKISEVVSTEIRLSDCQPVVTSAGVVTWYVTNGDTVTLYQINPYLLENYGSAVRSFTFADDTGTGTWTWASDYIYDCYDLGILNGYEDGTFLPDNSMSRAEVAKVIACALGLEIDGNAASSFSDVSDDHWAVPYIEACVDAGIINGYEDGTFRASQSVTRAEMAKLVACAYDLDSDRTGSSFTDVSSSYWALPYIEACVDAGIVSGMGDGTFAPSSSVTRAQAAKMIAVAVTAG